jgi:Protein of unknown function (DUF3822)
LQKYLYFAIKLSLLKPTFNIQVDHAAAGQLNLFLQIGEYHLAYTIIDNNSNCVAVAMYHLQKQDSNEDTANLLKEIVAQQPLLKDGLCKIVLIFDYPQAVLIPEAYMQYEAKKNMLQLVFGEMEQMQIKTEFNAQKAMHVIYAIPKIIDTVLTYIFSADITTHQYALLPNIVQQTNTYLYCVFNQSTVTILLVKNGSTQIMQTYNYKTPEDVAYYFLHTCTSFEIDINTLVVIVNGMIDKDSVLYTELYKYFLHIQFATLPPGFTYPETLTNTYPQHYFSNLFAVAACV